MNNADKQMYEQCKKYMHSYVLAEMNGGTSFDGIITGLDDEYVYFAVPNDGQDAMTGSDYRDESFDQRFFGYPGFGYGYGYGPGFGYGGGYGRPRRFRRLVLPLAALTALSLLPWY